MRANETDGSRLLRKQLGVASRQQLISFGVTPAALLHRTRAGGPWQRLLPAVYLTVTGQPTTEQQEMAALLYAGPGSVLTGPAALRLHGIGNVRLSAIDVLIPFERKRASCGFAELHRTRRMPKMALMEGERAFVLAARAVADTVPGLRRLSDARALVAAAVQQRRCTVTELAEEIRRRHTPRDALLRTVLAEVAAGIRSAPEAELRDLVRQSGLPTPMYNPRLYLHEQFLAEPDAWWKDAGVAAEVDSREYHLLPADWAYTLSRHDRMTAAGILVLHFTPAQLRTEPQLVVQQISAALRAGRPIDGITARSAAA